MYPVPPTRKVLPFVSFVAHEPWNDENGPRSDMESGNHPFEQGVQFATSYGGYSPRPLATSVYTGHYCGNEAQWAGDLRLARPGDTRTQPCCGGPDDVGLKVRYIDDSLARDPVTLISVVPGRGFDFGYGGAEDEVTFDLKAADKDNWGVVTNLPQQIGGAKDFRQEMRLWRDLLFEDPECLPANDSAVTFAWGRGGIGSMLWAVYTAGIGFGRRLMGTLNLRHYNIGQTTCLLELQGSEATGATVMAVRSAQGDQGRYDVDTYAGQTKYLPGFGQFKGGIFIETALEPPPPVPLDYRNAKIAAYRG